MGVSPVIHLSPSRSHLHPRLQRAGTGALMQRHHVREMETFHIVNPQVVKETLMRKETGKEHPGLLGGVALKTLRDRNVACRSVNMVSSLFSFTYGKQVVLPGSHWARSHGL